MTETLDDHVIRTTLEQKGRIEAMLAADRDGTRYTLAENEALVAALNAFDDEILRTPAETAFGLQEKVRIWRRMRRDGDIEADELYERLEGILDDLERVAAA